MEEKHLPDTTPLDVSVVPKEIVRHTNCIQWGIPETREADMKPNDYEGAVDYYIREELRAKAYIPFGSGQCPSHEEVLEFMEEIRGFFQSYRPLIEVCLENARVVGRGDELNYMSGYEKLKALLRAEGVSVTEVLIEDSHNAHLRVRSGKWNIEVSEFLAAIAPQDLLGTVIHEVGAMYFADKTGLPPDETLKDRAPSLQGFGHAMKNVCDKIFRKMLNDAFREEKLRNA